MTFGEKLKALREGADLTQAQLAERSGVPIGTIRDYEQVKRDPLLPTAVKLAGALGVSIAVFAECTAKDGPAPEEPARGKTAAPRGRGATGKGKGDAPASPKPQRKKGE